MDRIDLHTHSTASDGTMSPSELVNYAKQKGLAAMALTDHDTIDGLAEAVSEGAQIGVEVVPGIEINSLFNNLEVHIVGLFVNYKNIRLLDFCKFMRDETEKRNDKIIKKLNELGFQITLEELKKVSSVRTIAIGHFVKVLIEKGYVKDGKEAREKYFYGDGAAHFNKAAVSPKECVNIIKNAGGIPILAHPGELRMPKEDVKQLIIDLKGHGMEGIEAYYYSYDDEMTQFLKTVAIENNLLISGGSDYHGYLQPQTDLGVGAGNLSIPYEVLENIRCYLKRN